LGEMFFRKPVAFSASRPYSYTCSRSPPRPSRFLFQRKSYERKRNDVKDLHQLIDLQLAITWVCALSRF
jgi:hypothetical protein